MTLSSAERDAVAEAAMTWWSRDRVPVPINKAQLWTGVGIFDDEFENLDAAIIAAIPPGEIRDWMIAEPQIARQLEVLVAEARRENL